MKKYNIIEMSSAFKDFLSELDSEPITNPLYIDTATVLSIFERARIEIPNSIVGIHRNNIVKKITLDHKYTEDAGARKITTISIELNNIEFNPETQDKSAKEEFADFMSKNFNNAIKKIIENPKMSSFLSDIIGAYKSKNFK